MGYLGGYQGDYMGGYRGDPGILGFIGKAAKRIGGAVIGATPLGRAVQTARGIIAPARSGGGRADGHAVSNESWSPSARDSRGDRAGASRWGDWLHASPKASAHERCQPQGTAEGDPASGWLRQTRAAGIAGVRLHRREPWESSAATGEHS